ncbi:MAG TPA: sulfotransferase [Sphingomicrobium sp.]|nr:sulfotransferase [Sphingomicrobium sp.]
MSDAPSRGTLFGAGLSAFPRLSDAQRDFDEGRFDAAAGHVIRHLREHPDEPRGLALLGTIALRTGALVQGEQFLRRAISLGYVNTEVKRELATALQNQHRLDEALEAFAELERTLPDPRLKATSALILHQLGRASEALAAYETVLEQEPGDPGYWIAYGHCLRAEGQTDEAVAAYRRAIEIDVERGEAWWSIANVKSKILTDADLASMQGALEVAVDSLNIVPLHFALGRAWHDRGEFERAFHHYREGNRLRASEIRYDPGALSAEVDEFIRSTSRLAPSAPTIASSSSAVPIFLVSMPRSGSTLLEQILDQHPGIEAVGELPYVRALLRSVLELETRRRPMEVPELLRRLTPQQKQELGAEYMRRAALHRRTSAPYFIDKMPTNWSDILFIREILPQARVLEIRRDAMDCCFSNFIHQFSLAHAASFDLGHIGRCYVDYARLLDHLRSVAPAYIHPVRYEQLVESPKAVLSAVLDHLGLDWDEKLLRFHQSGRSVRTPSAEQVRRPLNRQGIGTWKPYEKWLGPLVEALGPHANV